MIMFAFEVDTLEISLKEQLPMVDKVFLVEATTSQKGKAKPLMWEQLKTTDRFKFANSSKVVHVVMDDVVEEGVLNLDHEGRQERVGVARAREWAGDTLAQDDAFVAADADEMMSRAALHQLRHCELSSDVVTGGLWMPLGNPGKAFRTQYPVDGRPHTLGLPTIYRWGKVRSGENSGVRRVQNRPTASAILGGVHLTHTSYLPNVILKMITGAEYTWSEGVASFSSLYSGVNLADLERQQAAVYNMSYVQVPGITCLQHCLKHVGLLKNQLTPQGLIKPSLLDDVGEATDIEAKLPWFLACNSQR